MLLVFILNNNQLYQIYQQYSILSIFHMLEDITCVFEGMDGVGAIYISNLKAARNFTLLSSLNIKALVTVVRGGIVDYKASQIQDYLYIPADDIQSYDLSQHFLETYNFIDNARKKTNILVHCYAGISRSATIVIAYLIRKYGYSLQKVLTMVKRKRNRVNPNRGFLDQLKIEASKIGVACQQNKQSLQHILRKYSISPNKKRSCSAKSIKKLQNQIETLKKSNILLESSHKSKQLCFNPVQRQDTLPFASKIIEPQTKQNQNSAIRLIKVQEPSQNQVIQIIQNNKLKQREEQFSTRSSTIYLQHQQQSVFKNKSNQIFLTKHQKIQKLKSKIFEIQNRKKMLKGHRKSNSQVSDNHPIDNSKTNVNNMPFTSLSTISQQKNMIQQLLYSPANPERYHKKYNRLLK